jgi:hypothetical protein
VVDEQHLLSEIDSYLDVDASNQEGETLESRLADN